VAQPARRICALVAYDGTAYNGFQFQENAPTIQGVLEESLSRCVGQFCRITGSGRTDTGVHASGQVVMADVLWRHSVDALARAWNHYLPSAVLVRQIVEAPSGFHPRFSATSRTYRYRVYHPVSEQKLSWDRFPILDRYALLESERLNVEAMSAAAQLLQGEHDFATFGQPPQGEVTIRYVEEVKCERVIGTPEVSSTPLELLVFTVRANAFLRRMVRNLVGTLLAVGRGEWQVDDVAGALAARDRSRSAPPAPPHGLVLERVDYSTYAQLFSNL
jgi:tRNA pseudouridine38-40 synthase